MASNAAQITKFVKNLEKSFDSLVEENGRNFSGGQKTKNRAARAPLQKSRYSHIR